MYPRYHQSIAQHHLLVITLAVFCVSSLAHGDVLSVGSLNPVPPVTGGTFNSHWVVGDEEAVNTDFRAWAEIDEGTALQYLTLTIGDEEDFSGEVNVLGNFVGGLLTRLTLSDAGSTTNPALQVGHEGTGRLNVRGGATVNLPNASSDVSIGVETTGLGYVTLSDPFTMLSLDDNLLIGQNGIGRLEIQNGALVRTIDEASTHAVTIGSQATGVGTVIVDGVGSMLRAASNLVVGGLGLGTLRISRHGIVDADTIGRTITVGLGGRVELQDGTLQGLSTTVNGYLGGAGLVRGTVNFNADSFLETGPDQLLRFDGDVSNQGAATIDGGEIHFLEGFTNNAPTVSLPPGRVTLQNGTVRFAETLINNGVIASAEGVNNIHGEITNQRKIVVASDTVAVFHDSVDDNGGDVDILPRGNALFLADLTFQANSAVLLSIGVDDATDNSAQISVAGAATLAGDLSIDLDSSYTPMLGESFELLTAAGGIVGMFDNEQLPDIPGTLEFGVLYNPTSVLLEVRIEQSTIPLPGDYNENGVVDAADYTLWRDTLGSTVTAFDGADGNGDGAINAGDYDVWKSNFGARAGSSSTPIVSASTTVPEPATVSLWLFALLFGCWLSRRPNNVIF